MMLRNIIVSLSNGHIIQEHTSYKVMQFKGHLCIDMFLQRLLARDSYKLLIVLLVALDIFLTLAFNILATLNTFTPTKQKISSKTTKSNQHQDVTDEVGKVFKKRPAKTEKSNREVTPRRVSPKKDVKVKHEQKKNLSK